MASCTLYVASGPQCPPRDPTPGPSRELEKLEMDFSSDEEVVYECYESQEGDAGLQAFLTPSKKAQQLADLAQALMEVMSTPN